ncbi:tail completion protein gp17 [Sphingomonas sanxanigenens]|uniref:DUF3168 domain-containing protein n=1 Tax=Sphingomonas sanxanigenens DSM 19645 = NX02 TaxID=1123269 RepID=W0ADC7_9SPHN|nr:DUF3168 domain-containing protein [Sphingomonas sanxanigenens]AHE55909.1 hypothetical protein NX02_21385 [Sphingomonas sanxanigenens DSM 19645 = NX02]
MEESLRNRLLAYADLSALVARRIWWIDRPQGSSLPALTLQLISPNRTYTLDGPSGFYGPRVQFDSWGASYADAKLVSRIVTAAVELPATADGIRFDAGFIDSERDMPITDIPGGGKAYRVSQDFFVWWKPQS